MVRNCVEWWHNAIQERRLTPRRSGRNDVAPTVVKMTHLNFEACIFDFDGVIIDSEPLHAEAKRITLEHFQVQYPPQLFSDFKGRPDKAFFEFVASQLAPSHTTSEAMENHKKQAYLQLFEQVALIPGFTDFIESARTSFPKLGLATSATRHDFSLAANNYQLQRWFYVIITGEDTAQHKPDPEPYLSAMAALKVSGPQTLVIEDSPNGVTAAKSAQCMCAAITTTFPASELYAAGADVVVASFAQLARFL